LQLLPPQFCELQSLTHLNLSNNKFRDLPWPGKDPDIPPFPNLRILDLSLNAFKTGGPSDLSVFAPGIENLKLSRANLRSIPIWIDSLSSLKILNLRGNEIYRVGFSLCYLTGLESLDLALNKISALPAPIQKLTNLKDVNFEGNDLLFEESGDSLSDYLRAEVREPRKYVAKKEGRKEQSPLPPSCLPLPSLASLPPPLLSLLLSLPGFSPLFPQFFYPCFSSVPPFLSPPPPSDESISGAS
jgi:Leucine-rich repeat (LRR) protein